MKIEAGIISHCKGQSYEMKGFYNPACLKVKTEMLGIAGH